MCGIVGYIGKRQAYPILIKGLKRLEYRGYDSAGVGLINGSNQLNIYKAKGKVLNLEETAAQKDVSGCIGIAHTRWATHGEPCQANAHPHVSQSGNLALVHNGIIENYASLRDQLKEKRIHVSKLYRYRSAGTTDRLPAKFVPDRFVGSGTSRPSPGNRRIRHCHYRQTHPRRIIAARKSSPLVIGVGNDEFFLASDATPIVEYTNQVVYLQDGDIAVLETGKPLKVVNLENELQPAEIKEIDMNIGTSWKKADTPISC